ncbi:related to serine/threonine-protein kinase pkwA [Fusarium torulosum]|uniref:Mitochondrial division protein 1 n=1 Tax=Fusarium torulosum TaxID=33205 RepID=A0AAE8MBR9_9HYPO|nr:related to serine/threonine-protein kinase pkwA [Fusarium torulosum]
MPSYSSDEFMADWRYAVEQDFTTSAGKPYPYADNGKLQWGNEVKKMTFKKQPHLGSVSHDGKFLALAVEHDIHVVDTQTWETLTVLKGHTSKINAVAFRPNDARTLISCDQPMYDRREPEKEPTIILWSIEEEQAKTSLGEDSLSSVARAAASVVGDKLAELSVSLDRAKIQDLGAVFEPAIERLVTEYMAAGKPTLQGQLVFSHESQVFSPSGQYVAYILGKRPCSNRDDPCDIKIISVDDLTKGMTLKGHTDAMMWFGWNSDESLFASVSWGGTIRIWDPKTGHEKHLFRTDHQNWTGSFSPDSKYFATVDGKANVRVYSMASDGQLHWTYEGLQADRWRRTISWHPNNQWLAVGGEKCGELLLLDIEEKKLLQKRLLSVDASTGKDEVRHMMKSFVGTYEVKFVDGGNKLAVWTFGDDSIEVYDINREVKWRFARSRQMER